VKLSTILLASTLVALGSPAVASSFTNGGFEELTNGKGHIGVNTDATGWTIGYYGWTFAFGSGTADTTGALASDGAAVKLWGPGTGSANGLPASSPSGGNFIAMDGNFPDKPTGPLSQLITGLTPGVGYTVGFDYAFAQQAGFDGDTTQNWTVNFGSETKTTENFDVPNHGFSVWKRASFDFTASSASQVLSFVAWGNVPAPPFALLDGVTLTETTTGAVPEPSNWAMLITGFGIVGAAARRRRHSLKVVAA
jgi:hypothetical protein